MKLAIVLGILLAASPAWAGWTRCPGTGTDTGTGVATPTPASREICLRQNTATDPARVNATLCRAGVDLIFNSDVAGATTTATAMPYQCPTTGTAGTFTDCEKIIVDRTGDGVIDDLPMNGDPAAAADATYDISPGWLAFDIANAGTTMFELRLVCK